VRRVDPTDPEYPYQPEPGSAEWVELRQKQTQEAGNETRRFQPHRETGTRAARTRRTLPEIWTPALALWALVYNIVKVNESFMDLGGPGDFIRAALIFLGFSYVLTYVRRTLLWLKDKD
jgi:hypothetical protein